MGNSVEPDEVAYNARIIKITLTLKSQISSFCFFNFVTHMSAVLADWVYYAVT